MRVSHRRAAVQALSALAISLLALTACGTEEDGESAASTPGTSEESSASAEETDPAAEEDDAAAEPEDAAAEPEDAAAEPEDAAADQEDTPAATGVAEWAGTKQFVQIEDAWTSGGQTFLSVRIAQKEAVITEHYEAWEIIPGDGPYVEVALAEDAQVMLAVPLGDDEATSPYSADEFVSRFTAQPAAERGLVGFDLSFDGDGNVARVESLYRS